MALPKPPEDEYRRIYKREHPLAIWLTLGIMVAGASAILFPESIQNSPVREALPELLLKVFYVAYFIGGAISFYGLVTAKHPVEAAGMALLAAALLSQYLSVVVVALQFSTNSIISATFILALAIGCGNRCYVLTVRR